MGPTVRVLAKDGVDLGVGAFWALAFAAAANSSLFDRVVLGASFEFAMYPMEGVVRGFHQEERLLNGRQDWKQICDALECCPRIAFIDECPIFFWYSLISSGTCTFDAGSQVLSESG